jgi:hypothetical protein
MKKRNRIMMGTGMEMVTETDMETTMTENNNIERQQDLPPDL